MPILLLRSKKLSKPLEKVCRISNSASWEKIVSLNLILWNSSFGILVKTYLGFFRRRALDQIYLLHMTKNTGQASQAMNEYLLCRLFWVGFFSFSLKFNHVPWLVLLNTYECPYSRRKLQSYSTFGPNFFKKWWFKVPALVKLTTFTAAEKTSFIGIGQVFNTNTNQSVQRFIAMSWVASPSPEQQN